MVQKWVRPIKNGVQALIDGNGELVHKPELMHDKRGRVMNDTCAVTLARRGLIRYLLHEAEHFYKHQYETKMDEFDNIFRMDPEAHLLILRDGIDIILYLSGNYTPPGGALPV